MFQRRQKIDKTGLIELQNVEFDPERGKEPIDIHSPFNRLAVFEVLLCTFDRLPPPLPQIGWRSVRARDI